MNAKDIAAKKFEKSTFGYKPEEVDEYLRDLALAYAQAVKEKEENEAKIVKLVEKINEYRNDEDAIRDALLIAQRQGKQILSEAKAEAEKLVAEAQAEHDAKLAEIAGDCERIKAAEIEKANAAIKAENDRLNAVVAASKTQIELQTVKLNKLKTEVTEFKKTLINLLAQQTKLAIELPEITDEQIEEIVNTQPEVAPVEEPAPAVEEKTEEAPAPVKVLAKEDKPVRKVASDPNFGFGTGYKRQSYTAGELKFGNNGNNDK